MTVEQAVAFASQVSLERYPERGRDRAYARSSWLGVARPTVARCLTGPCAARNQVYGITGVDVSKAKVGERGPASAARGSAIHTSPCRAA